MNNTVSLTIEIKEYYVNEEGNHRCIHLYEGETYCAASSELELGNGKGLILPKIPR